MRVGLAVAVLAAMVLALAPTWVPMLDTALTPQSVQETVETQPPSATGVQILVPSAVSYQGADRLEVYPGAVLAEPGSVINVTIKVFFKHAQPCPYSDWSVSYDVSGGIEVIADDGGRLVDAKTYERVLKVRVTSNGTLTVVYDYGTCPEGDKEVVRVDFYVGNAPASLGSAAASMTTSYTETDEYTTTTEESYSYVNVSGVVELVDPGSGIFVVNDTVVYVRGEFYDISTGEDLEADEVLSLIKQGDTITAVCKITSSGKYMAEKIILSNGVILTKG